MNKIDFLWHSFLNGDDESFAVIYQTHIEKLLSYGYKISKDRDIVNDCIQEIFLDLFAKKLNQKNEINNLKSYLFVALRNSVVKKLAKIRKQNVVDINDSQSELSFYVEYSTQDIIIEAESSEEIKKTIDTAVKNLSSRQKEVIYLKFDEGMEYEEISEIMKISVESSRKLLYRAIKELREIVDLERFVVHSKKRSSFLSILLLVDTPYIIE